MKSADFRNATWREVLTHVQGDMLKVHEAWRRYGPGTTEEVAQRAQISIFTFRPRTTDLGKLGLVALTPGQTVSAGGGIYEFRTPAQAEEDAVWRERADFRRKKGEEESSRVGFITVDEAVDSLTDAEKAALGARLMSQYGHRAKRLQPAEGQLTLLPA